jgi:phosphatidylglycerophosphatase A
VNTLRLGIATFGFLGLAPYAPGTIGTLGGVALAWLLAGTSQYLLWTLLAAALLYVLGRAVAPWAEARAGKKDPGWFVIDEVIGYLITVAWLGGPTALTLFVGFCLFRCFDIVKPWPVRWFERLGGGDGIILDDVMAGLYAFGVLALLRTLTMTPAQWTIAAVPA